MTQIDEQLDRALCLQLLVKWALEVLAATTENRDQFERWAQEDPTFSRATASGIVHHAVAAMNDLATATCDRHEAVEEADAILGNDAVQ